MNHHSDNNDKNLDKILKEKLHLFKTVENGQKEAEARKPATVMCKNCMFVAFLSQGAYQPPAVAVAYDSSQGEPSTGNLPRETLEAREPLKR